tara:strand:+ start:1416 stop:1793 length:378 start_codon:yes stop_codon:yes gene_type:complete
MSTIKVDTVQSTGGGAVTLTNQHAIKAWYGYDLYDSQNSFEGSFNIASGTDDGTGLVTATFTNAMSSQDYTPAGAAAKNGLMGTQATNSEGKASRTTSAFKSSQVSYNGSAFDGIHYIHIAGDLA